MKTNNNIYLTSVSYGLFPFLMMKKHVILLLIQISEVDRTIFFSLVIFVLNLYT